jgi:hypothetical protein
VLFGSANAGPSDATMLTASTAPIIKRIMNLVVNICLPPRAAENLLRDKAVPLTVIDAGLV